MTMCRIARLLPRWRWWMLTAPLVGVCCCCLLLMPLSARAEELPLLVPLSYTVNLSNWGPTTATGTASVWRIDAEVRLKVQGLPVLTGQLYACWLVDQQGGKFLAVGRFNVGSDGSAIVDVTLPGSLPSNYNAVLITVQPDPSSNKGAPSKLYSIAGFFPGNSAIQKQVNKLPDTGANAEHPPFEPPSAYGGGVAETIAPAAVHVPAKPTSWLTYLPLLIAFISFGFVIRRSRQRR